MDDSEGIWPELQFPPINLWTVWPTSDMVILDWEYRDDKDLLLEENDGYSD